MTYASTRPWLVALTPSILLVLGACDGDLGKDSASDDTAAGTADGDGGEAGSASMTGPVSGTAGGSGDGSGDGPGDGPVSSDAGSDAGSEGGVGECTDEECGPAPGAPSQLCPDGVNYSGPGPCVRNDEGVCGYTWVECPPCCDVVNAPDCPEPITCCGDGSWSCGGPETCDGGATALECDGGGTDSGGACVDEQGSCAAGETCCAGLNCCAGVPVPPGQEYCGMECPISDRNKKENFAEIDVHEVLDRVSQLEITTWNYTSSPTSVRHLGPMAQDFQAAFGIGGTDKAIFQVDADGVALASIQALDDELDALRTENATLKKALADVTRRLDALEK